MSATTTESSEVPTTKVVVDDGSSQKSTVTQKKSNNNNNTTHHAPRRQGSGGKSGKAPCVFFNKSGGCRNGAACTFEHVKGAPAPSPPSSLSSTPESGKPKQRTDKPLSRPSGPRVTKPASKSTDQSETARPEDQTPSTSSSSSHNASGPARRPPTVVCKYWLESSCLRGSECWFLHANPSDVSSSSPSSPAPAVAVSSTSPHNETAESSPSSTPTAAPATTIVVTPVGANSTLKSASVASKPVKSSRKASTARSRSISTHTTQPAYNNNLPLPDPRHVCRFWQTGACKRGNDCMFLHADNNFIISTLRPQLRNKTSRLDRSLFVPLVEGNLAGVQKWLKEHPLAGLEVAVPVVESFEVMALQPVSASTSSDSLRGSNSAVQSFGQLSDALYIASLLSAVEIAQALFNAIASAPALVQIACEPKEFNNLQNLLRRVSQFAISETPAPAATGANPLASPLSSKAVGASATLRGVGKDPPLTPIEAAAHSGCIPLVKFFLDAGISQELSHADAVVAEQFRRAPTTILMRACARAQLELVRFLLQRQTDSTAALSPDASKEALSSYLNIASPVRRSTAIHFAASSSDRRPNVGLIACDIVHLLIDSGADVNACDCNDMTALLFAAGKAPLPMIRTLLESGAIPMAADDGYSPLTATIRQERVDAVRLLLDYGADPNNAAGQGGGWLPLAAVRSDRSASLEILHLLMQHGANVHMIGSVDRLLVGKKCPKAAAVLLGYGAPLGETYQFIFTMNDYLDGSSRTDEEETANDSIAKVTNIIRGNSITDILLPGSLNSPSMTLFISSQAVADTLENPALEKPHPISPGKLIELRSGKALCCSKCHVWFFGSPAAKRRIRARSPGEIGRHIYSVIDLDFCSQRCWQSSFIAGSIQPESRYQSSPEQSGASATEVLFDKMSLPELLASGDPESKRIHILYKFKSDLSISMYELYLTPSEFTLEGFKAALHRGSLQPPPDDSQLGNLIVANLDTWHPYTSTSFPAACLENSELSIGLDWKIPVPDWDYFPKTSGSS